MGAGVGAMSRAMGIEGTQKCRVRSILRFVSNRTHEASDPREEEFGITDPRLDFEGGHPECTEIARMPQIAERQDGPQRHEDEARMTVRMFRQACEDRNPSGGGEARKATSPARLVAGEKKRSVFEQQEEGADLEALCTGKRGEVAIDVVGQLGFDSRHRQAAASRKEDLRRRIDERRLSPMQYGETRRRRCVARQEASMNEKGERDEKKRREHGSRIPDRLRDALAVWGSQAEGGSISPWTQA